MTQDEIIRSPIGREQLVALAREAGWPIESGNELPDTGSMNLERFAALVAAHERKKWVISNESLEEIEIKIPYVDKLIEAAVLAEREACAKVCDDWPDYDVQGLAAAIRNRSNK